MDHACLGLHTETEDAKNQGLKSQVWHWNIFAKLGTLHLRQKNCACCRQAHFSLKQNTAEKSHLNDDFFAHVFSISYQQSLMNKKCKLLGRRRDAKKAT